jgi:hypothetical protein
LWYRDFYLIVPLSVFPTFFTFNEEHTAIESIKVIFVLGNENWLVIIMGVFAEFGVILRCVGIFFTAMLGKAPTYYMYKYGVDFEEAA